jgi:hypothetical protein
LRGRGFASALAAPARCHLPALLAFAPHRQIGAPTATTSARLGQEFQDRAARLRFDFDGGFVSSISR